MSMAITSVGTQAVGGLGGIISTYQGARARKSSMQFEADMSDINARLAESTAQGTLLAGRAEEQRSRLQTAQLKSSQRAAMAANGIALDEGSAADVLTSTDVLGEIDANTIHANAVRAAWGYRTQSMNARNDALLRRSAAGGLDAGAAAVTSLIGSATQVSSSWYRLNKDGAFDAPKTPKTMTGQAPADAAWMGGFGALPGSTSTGLA
jgi:hypothetical protein